jgi:type IV secretion system protein VirB10
MYFLLTKEDKPPEVVERKPKISEKIPEYSLPEPPKPKKIEPPKPEPKPVIAAIPPPPVVKKPVEKVDNTLERLLAPVMGSDVKQKGQSSGSSNTRSGPSLRAGNGKTLRENLDLRVTKTEMVQATRMRNQSFIVPKGVPIPCAMNTAIQSDQSGLITCTTTEDIYSSDGSLILIDRGSAVTGEYRSATLRLGKRRIFAIWDRIRTPSGVLIQLDSPATGPLGRAGIGGHIDNHYLERWGAAVLISLIYDQFDNNSTQQFDRTEDEIEDIATEFLNQYRTIQPTLHRHQGSEVAILVARDLDFSTVFELADAR